MDPKFHVYPTNDLQPHVTYGYPELVCPCNPRIEDVNGQTLIIHNSYDGRETWEQIEALKKSSVQ